MIIAIRAGAFYALIVFLIGFISDTHRKSSLRIASGLRRAACRFRPLCWLNAAPSSLCRLNSVGHGINTGAGRAATAGRLDRELHPLVEYGSELVISHVLWWQIPDRLQQTHGIKSPA